MKPVILIILTILAVLISGCTSGQDVTPIVKAIPEVQEFLKEHPNAKITVTYWSKEEIAKFEQEISQQCDKPITPAAMYKAVISEGDLKSIAWIDAATQNLICSTTEGKGITTPTSTQTATYTPVVTTPVITQTSTPTITPTAVPTSGPYQLLQGYELWLGAVSPLGNGQVKDITMRLMYNRIVVGEQTLAIGNDFSLYDGGALIVRAKLDAFLEETITPTLFLNTVKLSNLVQYDKAGNVIFTKDALAISMPVPVPSHTTISTPTPTYTRESDALTQGYRLSFGIISWGNNNRVTQATIRLIKDGIIVDEKSLIAGSNLNLYDSGELIVKANFDAFLYGAEASLYGTTANIVKLSNLVQYDKATGGIILTKDVFLIIFPQPTSTPTSTVASTAIPTPTSTPTPASTTSVPTPTSTSLPSSKTMTAGETWNLGNGYALATQAIDALASPRQVWIVFSKDGHKLDDKIISEGYTYTYGTIFSTKIASIYYSDGKDYVRFENAAFL